MLLFIWSTSNKQPIRDYRSLIVLTSDLKLHTSSNPKATIHNRLASPNDEPTKNSQSNQPRPRQDKQTTSQTIHPNLALSRLLTN